MIWIHILILVEGYSDRIKETVTLISQKLYSGTNPVDGKKTNWNPAIREIKLYNIVIPEQCKEELLKDLNHYKPTEKNFKRWKNIIGSVLNLFKPMGFKKINTLEPSDPVRSDLVPHGVGIVAIAEKEDRKDEKSGWEYLWCIDI